MEKDKEKHTDQESAIELRTERTRTFIEEKPGWWLRWGTTVTALLFLLLVLLIARLPYPHTGSVPVWRHLIEKIG